MTTPLLLPVREVAQLLGLSERSVMRLEKRGELQAVRIGTRVLYPRIAVEQFVERLSGDDD
jgi:excisionase family DNA binding protein